MKVCSKCNAEKTLSEFHKHPLGINGYHPACKVCRSEERKRHYQNNRQKILVQTIQYNKRHKNRVAIYNKQWRKDHRTRMNQLCYEWLIRNPGKIQRRIVRRQTPLWANIKKIARIYELARWASKFTDEQLHVDHIVPLQGRLIAGLHVENNLQILPASQNCSKGNKF